MIFFSFKLFWFILDEEKQSRSSESDKDPSTQMQQLLTSTLKSASQIIDSIKLC